MVDQTIGKIRPKGGKKYLTDFQKTNNEQWKKGKKLMKRVGVLAD